MSDPAPELEPPPFSDPDDPYSELGAASPRPWEPVEPMTQDDLDRISARPPHLRTSNPWQCAFNLNADDGIGYLSGMSYHQCPTLVADPTRNRYCLEHARQLGIDYNNPVETSEATDAEVAGSLTRLVPKAVKTLEDVMNDADAPAGIRGKAAVDVLDRTGYAKGLDVRVDAKVSVVDVTGIIQDRLDALRESQLKGTAGVTGIPDPTPPTSTPTPLPDVLALPGPAKDDGVHGDTGRADADE